uniref:Uncharacterized protein n=1 Tax=Pseudictyota dubia TaxID=2749911 RepID=A0A7R9WHX9_9STRA
MELEIANAKLELEQSKLDARAKMRERDVLNELRIRLTEDNATLLEDLATLREEAGEIARERDSLKEVTERLLSENTALVEKLDRLRIERDTAKEKERVPSSHSVKISVNCKETEEQTLPPKLKSSRTARTVGLKESTNPCSKPHPLQNIEWLSWMGQL